GDAVLDHVRRAGGLRVDDLGVHVQARDPVPQQLTQLAQLALVPRGEDEPRGRRGARACAHRSPARVSCWIRVSSVVPSTARSSRVSSSARRNGAPSAVPWTSTKSPDPVTTTFMSV